MTSLAGRVALLSPRGRDADVIDRLLSKGGIESDVCCDFASWTIAVEASADIAIVTEEAMVGADTHSLFAWLDDQPAWSDYPFIVLATRQIGPRTKVAGSILERLGNVILLERPVNAETLTSAVKSALRSRRRQYQAREHLAELEAAREVLRLANENLEGRVLGRTREVEAARETLAFALESAQMGTWDLDLVRNTARRSRSHDRIFGHERWVGTWRLQDFFDHVVDDDREAARLKIEEALESGELDLECRIRQPSGSTRWIAVKGRVTYDDEDAPIRMAGIVRDRTALQATEEALRQSQKMEAVDQLTGGLAHDFNNLLTGITGGLDLIKRRVEQGRVNEIERYLTASQDAAERAAALTHRLLAFSRRQTLAPKATDVERLVAGMRDLIDRTVGPEIAVEVIATSDLWPTLVDPSQLENALLNLCINARDAMPDGGRIVIETENKHLDDALAGERDLSCGDYVSLSVSDTGTGMTPEVIARVFDPFFTTKPLGMGTGLGLSMIYGFARQSNGQIRVHSEPGSGTTMRLLLPRHAGAADAARSHADLKDAPRSDAGETVLVVDDEPTVRMLVVEVLRDLGYDTIEAEDGASGLKILRTDARVDLLITDVGLPGGMNGRQVADAGLMLRPDLKVLFITGYAESVVLGQGSMVPGMHVMTKPFAMETLATRIRSILGR